MAYPTNLTTFTTHAIGDIINPDFDNEQQIAISGLEAKVGVDASAVTTSHDYKLGEVTGSDKAVGKTATQTLTNKTLTSPVVNVGSDATGDMYYRNAGVLTRIAVGTDNQIMKLNGTTPNWEAEATTVDASTTVKGIVEAATSAEVTAGTATGGTGAVLTVTPDALLTSFYATQTGFVGDGSDGDVTISAGTTTLTRDMYYNNLTIQTGGILDNGGYRISVKILLTFQGTAKISSNGGNGTAATTITGAAGGTARGAGSVYGGETGTAGASGGSGAVNANGVAGTAGIAGVSITGAVGITGASASTSASGAGGGASGFIGGAAASGAAGGTVTNPKQLPRNIQTMSSLHFIENTTIGFMKSSASTGGAAGGGGGAQSGTGAAGGSGGGGGGSGSTGGVTLVIANKVISVANDCIQALGGNGGAGANGGNGGGVNICGGGGGGCGGNGGTGGVVAIAYRIWSGTALTTACVAGGTAGAGGTGGTQTGGGVNGTAGASGVSGATGVLYSLAI